MTGARQLSLNNNRTLLLRADSEHVVIRAQQEIREWRSSPVRVLSDFSLRLNNSQNLTEFMGITRQTGW